MINDIYVCYKQGLADQYHYYVLNNVTTDNVFLCHAMRNYAIMQLQSKSFLSLHRFIVLNLSFYRCRLQNQSFFSFYRFIVLSFHHFIVFW